MICPCQNLEGASAGSARDALPEPRPHLPRLASYSLGVNGKTGRAKRTTHDPIIPITPVETKAIALYASGSHIRVHTIREEEDAE